ncbi:MAG: hypothetical protein AAF411_32155 [Myxococcota bacterium]
MASNFEGTVGRTYVLQGDRVLIMEDYEGEIAPGETVHLKRPAGESAPLHVKRVAWGSAFHADNPPLTLIVDPVDAAIAPGSKLVGS